MQALHSLAALYEGACEAPLEALRFLRRILAIDPNDTRAKGALERLLETAAQAGDRISFYQEQAQAAASDPERVSILRRLARESFRQLELAPLDYVVMAKKDTVQATNQTVRGSLDKHFRRLSDQAGGSN